MTIPSTGPQPVQAVRRRTRTWQWTAFWTLTVCFLVAVIAASVQYGRAAPFLIVMMLTNYMLGILVLIGGSIWQAVTAPPPMLHAPGEQQRTAGGVPLPPRTVQGRGSWPWSAR